MNFTDIQPFITPLGVIAAACIAVYGYGRQKKVELEKSLIETRRTLYRSYLSYLTTSTEDRSPENRSKYLAVRAELSVVGTDDVLFALSEFTQYTTKNSVEKRDNEMMKSLVAKIVLSMRKDCFSQSKLDLDTAKATLPFN